MPEEQAPVNHKPVDFVVNTFERTYRTVLAPGFIGGMSRQHCFPFANQTLLINNVRSPADARKMALALRETGEITEFHFVEDLLEGTLQAVGLTRRDIEPDVHYSDCSLVAMCLAGSDYVVYCDADVRLRQPCDWISPSQDLMERESRIAVTNPNWQQPTLAAEAREYLDGFAVGYGFSDQLYMVRRSEFGKPIYRFHTPISLRYPMSERGRIFEQRVDSYMRRCRRMRGTYTGALYMHEDRAAYPRLTTWAHLRKARNQLILRSIRLLPGRHPSYHI